MTTENPSQSRPSATFQSLDDLSAAIPPVTWLWPGWIPRGMITLLCATSGAGKSYLALDLAHRLIAGLPWPDGTSQGPAGTPQGPAGAPSTESGANVIYVDAEAAPQLLNDRAQARGMDRSHLYPVFPPGAVPSSSIWNGLGLDGVLDLSLPPFQNRLLAMAAALHPALIVVDSLGSAAQGVENHVGAVEALFRYLNVLATRSQAAVLLIHHLRKGLTSHAALAQGSLDGEDVRGSGHIVSLARSVIGLAQLQDLAAVRLGLEPDPHAPRRLQLLKTNLGPSPAPLGVTFEDSPAGGVGLAYGPAARPSRPRTGAESCAVWLLETLRAVNRPTLPRLLEKAAANTGYSRTTFYRARDLLGSRIVDTRTRHSPGNCWALAEWQSSAAAAPPPSSLGSG